MSEKHQTALRLRALRLPGERERDALLLPFRHAVGFPVRKQGDRIFEVDHNLMSCAHRSGKCQEQDEESRNAHHAFVSSKPDIVPVDDANRSVSIAMRWSMETNRFGSG